MKTYIVLIGVIVTVNCDNDTEVLKLIGKYELLEIAKNITIKVLDPNKIIQPHRLPQTPGEAFIYDVYRYRNRLNAIYMMMLSENEDGWKVMRYLYNHNGPEHLSLILDYRYLTDYYKFEKDDVEDIKDMFERTKKLWLKMCDKLEEKHCSETEEPEKTIKSKNLEAADSLSKLELVPLGKNITRRISKKQQVTNKTISDLFLNDIYKYKNRLDSLIMMVRSNNSKGTMIYNLLSEKGGPPHIKRKLDYGIMKNIYNFNDEEIEEVELMINKTRTNWEDLVSLPKTNDNSNWW